MSMHAFDNAKTEGKLTTSLETQSQHKIWRIKNSSVLLNNNFQGFYNLCWSLSILKIILLGCLWFRYKSKGLNSTSLHITEFQNIRILPNMTQSFQKPLSMFVLHYLCGVFMFKEIFGFTGFPALERFSYGWPAIQSGRGFSIPS